MVIKQRLEQRQGQTIQMTPQLRHAIKLLELPNADLMTYLQALCLENPLIRVDGPTHGTLETGQDFDNNSYEYYWNADPMIESKPPLKAPDKTLKQHGQAYIDLVMTDTRERLIAGHFLDHLDANGYLTLDLEQVAQHLKCSRDILENLLKRLQSIEPTGLFARTLQECLALQCQEEGIDTDILEAFFKYQDLFLKGDFARLQKKCLFQRMN